MGKINTVVFQVNFYSAVTDSHKKAAGMIRKFYYMSDFVVETEDWKGFDGKIGISHITMHSVNIEVLNEKDLPMQVFIIFHNHDDVREVSLQWNKDCLELYVKILKYCKILPVDYKVDVKRSANNVFIKLNHSRSLKKY